MPSVRIFRSAIAALLGVLLLAAAGAAKDGRDFAGVYSLTNVAEQNGKIQATLTLQLFNYSGDDLEQAIVVVRGSNPGSDVLAAFAPIVVWRKGTEVTISQQVTVPREEFERWGARRQPSIAIVERHGGREWQRTAQVNRRATIPLGNNQPPPAQ
jgi:hypothetical protein